MVGCCQMVRHPPAYVWEEPRTVGRWQEQAPYYDMTIIVKIYMIGPMALAVPSSVVKLRPYLSTRRYVMVRLQDGWLQGRRVSSFPSLAQLRS